MGKLIEFEYKLYLLSEKAKTKGLTPKENRQFDKLIEWFHNPGDDDILID